MRALFEHYVIVDWSAANQPKQGRDSIWICHRSPRGETWANPATRHLARRHLAEIIAGVVARGERAVIGFDFPFGYPQGFAGRLGLDGVPWRSVWNEISCRMRDEENNCNNRFEVGANFNKQVSGKAFPFWGCPAGKSGDFLGMRHHRGHDADEPLRERRLIDTWMVGAQPCWKLAYTGSVGSQALTGIPVVQALRFDPRWAQAARIWPFETGLAPPAGARLVFAEVWPSWWQHSMRLDYGPPQDRAQVRTVAEIFAARDQEGELARWFGGDPGLSAAQRHIVETEEAWTLGVTAPRERRAPARAERALPSVPGSEGGGTAAVKASEGRSPGCDYLRDPAAIYRRSFALIRQEADLRRVPAAFRPVALRLAHAAGDAAFLDDLAWSEGAVLAGRWALRNGAAVIVDSDMVAAGIIRDRLPGGNKVICTLRDAAVPALAAERGTTRSAAAVELWQPNLEGAVVAIGNAPTALFRLLELLAAGAGRPVLVLGFPVGFVGAAEANEALIRFGRGLDYITLRGRRGGSALAAAAVNALAAGGRR